MALVPGTRLGPYEIVSSLGAGGMGEVYRARDTRLDRTVAVKILPPAVADDGELRARFEREARAASQLNHPHICALYDVGRQDGIDYLVVEYLEGESLADRLKKGPLPLEAALRCGVEIADALDRAHRAGIVHRDLKPGNVMLTKAGSKLLDFGLAKVGSEAGFPGLNTLSSLPTEAKPLTQAGTILGTFQYMAPEQLEGKPADARTDIFAFGSVLHEMVTGKRAFEGKSHASLIAAILEKEPAPISTLLEVAPPVLDRVVRTCLAKDPDKRWQSAHDVASELQWISETALAPVESKPRASRAFDRLLWALGGAAVATALAAAVLRRSAPEPALVRFEIAPPTGTELGPLLAVAPDDSRIAFTATGEDGVARLYVYSLETGASQPVPGTEGIGFAPFWSPDSRSIGFWAEAKLKMVDVAGGAPQTICSAGEARGASWNRDGVILFTRSGGEGLVRVAASGGVPEPVTSLDPAEKETSHRWPFFLPDGRRFLFMSIGGVRGSIALASLDRGVPKRRLLDVVSAPIHAATGHLLFVRDGALRAQPLDAKSARLSGESSTLADGVRVATTPAGTTPVGLGTRILAFRTGRLGVNNLVWLDRTGRAIRSYDTSAYEGSHLEQALSPDGRKAAVHTATPDGDTPTTILDLESGTLTRFSFGEMLTGAPRWSPDGRFIAYASNRTGVYDIVLAPAAGGGRSEVLVEDGRTHFTDDFAPDGSALLYETLDPKTNYDLWLVPLSGDRKPLPFLQTAANEAHAKISPNGRFVAYASDVSGRSEVYVRAFPGGEGPWQVSTEGADEPQWRADGKELFYVARDRKLIAVPVDTTGAVFRAELPTVLFRMRIRSSSIGGPNNQYAPSADGQRFLVSQLVEDPTQAGITVVVNWPALLKR